MIPDNAPALSDPYYYRVYRNFPMGDWWVQIRCRRQGWFSRLETDAMVFPSGTPSQRSVDAAARRAHERWTKGIGPVVPLFR